MESFDDLMPAKDTQRVFKEYCLGETIHFMDGLSGIIASEHIETSKNSLMTIWTIKINENAWRSVFKIDVLQ